MKEKITDKIMSALTDSTTPLTARELATRIGNTSSGSVAMGCGWLFSHGLIEVQHQKNKVATYAMGEKR